MALKSALNAVDRIRNVHALELLALERLAAHHGIPGLTETMGPLRERGARPESIGTASDSIESFPPQQAHSPWRPRAGQCAELMRYHVNDAGRITVLEALTRFGMRLPGKHIDTQQQRMTMMHGADLA